MSVIYSITPELRAKLKEPFDVLIRGTFSETMSQLVVLVEREKPPKIVSVGDTVSRNLHATGIKPQLSITDNKSMRKRTQPANFCAKKVVHVKNPQGTITDGAIAAIREALEGDVQTHIIVDGEEDLLTLAVVLQAPKKALVVYGQPYEGIVVVKVTQEKKNEAQEILNAMAVRKAK
jgi:GTP-dependent dephospho-CoA kinase